jgi:hypothetical protein
VQALASSTQQEQYIKRAQEAATALQASYTTLVGTTPCPITIYMWGCYSLAAQPMLHTAGASIPLVFLVELAAAHLQLMRLLQQCSSSVMRLPFGDDPWEREAFSSDTQVRMWGMMSVFAPALPDACK